VGWANLITVVRGLFAAIVWIATSLAESHGEAWWWAAFTLFVLTAATDVLDGWVARSLGEVSVFGRIADPLVDKLLVIGTMAVLVSVPGVRDVLPVWVVLLVVARELIVTALRAAVENDGASFQASFSGKVKMLVQCIAIGAILLCQAGVGFLCETQAWLGGRPLALVFALLAALVTTLSLVDYLRRAVRLLGRA
jgi:CDP-diacylglycerol--glycerol-3-phosphate 3-phosphatidyltransferase